MGLKYHYTLSNFDQISGASLLHSWLGAFACPSASFQLSRSIHSKESAMFDLTNILLTVGAFALISGVTTVVSAYRKKSKEAKAPFLHYFEPEYDRNLFPQDSWGDDENLYHLQTRVNVLEVRELSAAERHSKGNGTTQRD
jgi:hypothetical protein